jgi:hypothetical protein
MYHKNYTEALENRYITRVSLNADFDENKAALRHVLADSSGNIIDAVDQSDISDDIIDALPKYSRTAKRRDTKIGGNDAINSYYQFCENDDVIHQINRTSTDENSGMGRVYNETFDEQQQILYLSFGVPDFTKATTFIQDSYDTDLGTLMNTGDVSKIGKIGNFLGKAVGTALFWPIMPFKYALDILGSEASPEKLYDFKPSMALYYRTVNVILAHLAANMNLLDIESPSDSGTPDLLKKHGLDILTILSRKNWYDETATNPASPTTDEILQKLSKGEFYEKSIWDGMSDGVSLGLTEALRYIGFRVEKSVDSTETASNQTKETEIAAMVNQQVAAGRSRNLMANLLSGGLEKVAEGVSEFATGVAQQLKITGIAEVTKGSGFIDVPEIWASSSFNKNYSFEIELRSPYGDPFSIFYSLYVPLALLIAGAFPRSVGQNAYTSPFIVRAFCQGMFAIPLGIIDSITIRRGAQEYGWADGAGSMLPTQINVSFTIKDLSPVMHVAILDDSFTNWFKILGQNSNFQEYLLTLAGADVAQRTLKLELIKKRAKALLKILSNNRLNPMMFGFSLTNTKLGNVIVNLNPVSRLPGRVPAPRG